MSSQASSSADKRPAEVQAVAEQNKKPKLSGDDIRKHEVFLVYKNYLTTEQDAKDNGLQNFVHLCERFNWIPSLNMINWLIKEAKLIDAKHRLEFPVYPFLQEYKFGLGMHPETKQPRILVGTIPFAGMRSGPLEVWAGWAFGKGINAKQANHPPELVLYHMPEAMKHDVGLLDLDHTEREYIVWEEPFETLFGMSKLVKTPCEDRWAPVTEKPIVDPDSIAVQNAIILSVARVVLRFPGLVKSFAADVGSFDQSLFEREFSSRPFDIREAPSRHSPYWWAIEIVNTCHAGYTAHRCHPPDSAEFTTTDDEQLDPTTELNGSNAT